MTLQVLDESDMWYVRRCLSPGLLPGHAQDTCACYGTQEQLSEHVSEHDSSSRDHMATM